MSVSNTRSSSEHNGSYNKSNYIQSSSLPFFPESEANVLGNIILNQDLLTALMELDSETFYDSKNQIIFKALKEMHSKNLQIDVYSLCYYLNETNKDNESGGASHITYLTEQTLPKETFQYHVKILVEAANKRSLWKIAVNVASAIENDKNIAEIYSCIRDIQNYISLPTKSNIIKLSDLPYPQPRKWLLKDAIPWGYPTSIYADGGIGKSFLALYLGIMASIGNQSFLGLNFPSKPIKTLYIDWELEETEIKRRTTSIANGLRLPKEPEDFHYLAPKKSIYKLIPEISLLANEQYELIIIDSLGAACLDAENVFDVVQIFSSLKELVATTILIDHQPKQQSGDRYSNKTQYGSVYKFNLSRSQFQLSREENYDNKVTLKLRHNKSNFGRLLDDLLFDISFERDQVLFLKSDKLSEDQQDMEMILEVISSYYEQGEKINMKILTKNLSGVLGKDRIHNLLEKGKDRLWTTVPGNRKEKVLIPKI